MLATRLAQGAARIQNDVSYGRLPWRRLRMGQTHARDLTRPDSALGPLKHGVEELHLLFLQIAQRVFGDSWKSFADQDVKAERRQ